VLVFRRFRLPL